MISPWRCILLGVVIALNISLVSPAASEVRESAPFSTESSLRKFSDFLMTQIAKPDLDEAKALAKRNSHLDDEIAQQNLDEVFSELKGKLAEDQPMASQFVQQSNFGRSFIRHQYSLSDAHQSIRCMLTYRRKTSGWRLNQLWCS